MRRFLTVMLASAVLAAAGADGEARRARTQGRTLSDWNVGPFFQYRRAAVSTNGAVSTFWAVRPFFSQVRDDATDTVTHDVLWPLVARRRHYGATWFRALTAYGDGRDDAPARSFGVFPFWFSGTDRAGADYWGVFPLYGTHPNLLFMDDWEFALWPCWQTYTVKGVRSHGVFWPFITWRDAPRAGAGVWPLLGTARRRESDHGYCLWPFVTWAAYAEDRDTPGAGSSWMVWPFYGQVRRARERQTLLVPPFFSRTETPTASRWRFLWPFVETVRSRVRDRTNVWPLWESVHGYSFKDGKGRSPPEEDTWRLGWQLVENMRLRSGRTEETRFSVFPFWTDERRYVTGTNDVRNEVSSYRRLWPFWSSETVKGRSRRRALELVPIRHSEGLDRNWSPFWTLWQSEARPDGRTRHSLFWHLVTWHTGEAAIPAERQKERNTL